MHEKDGGRVSHLRSSCSVTLIVEVITSSKLQKLIFLSRKLCIVISEKIKFTTERIKSHKLNEHDWIAWRWVYSRCPGTLRFDSGLEINFINQLHFKSNPNITALFFSWTFTKFWYTMASTCIGKDCNISSWPVMFKSKKQWPFLSNHLTSAPRKILFLMNKEQQLGASPSTFSLCTSSAAILAQNFISLIEWNNWWMM